MEKAFTSPHLARPTQVLPWDELPWDGVAKKVTRVCSPGSRYPNDQRCDSSSEKKMVLLCLQNAVCRWIARACLEKPRLRAQGAQKCSCCGKVGHNILKIAGTGLSQAPSSTGPCCAWPAECRQQGIKLVQTKHSKAEISDPGRRRKESFLSGHCA